MTRYSKTMRDALNEVYLVEKVDKKLALKILSMMKNQKFVKVSGDFVPEIYLSGMDRDALKKEFGRLPRGLPNASNGVPVVDFINYALGLDNEIDTEDGDKPQPKLYDYRKGKVIGKPKTVGDAAKMAGLRLEGMEYEEEEILDEWVEIDEMKMNDPKLVRKFDKLKRGDTVKLKTSSTISKGTDFVDYVVKAKNTVNKGRVEKITLVTKGNEKAVKKFLYKRDGKVTFAIGDMGASIDDIKEKLGKDADAGDYIDDFKKSDAPQFKGKSDKKKRDMAIAAYLDAKDKKEEVEVDEAKSQGMFIVLEKGSKNKVIGQFKDKKKAIDMMKKNAGSKVIQIGKFATLDDKPVDIKVGDELSYTRVKLSKKIKEEVELDEAKYDLYHKDFSSAMQHAYAMAKKLHGITIDPKEIDNKVATGPRKPGTGKTNTYRLKGDKGNIQIQVYNKGGSKPFELNMYKEGLDKDDEPTVKKVVKMLKKASNAHASQAKDLEKDLKDEKELDEAVKYKFVAIDRLGKVIGFASDEKDAKDMARRGHTMDSPSKGKGVVGRNKAKVVKLKKPMSDKQGDMMINRDFDMNKFGGETTYSIGIKEEDKPDKPDSAKAVDQARDDKKKTRIAQLQLQIAKASEMINKLNSQEKPDA